MPSALIESLYERLLHAYPADRTYAVADWREGPMPDPVRHFLTQILKHRAETEIRRLRTARSEWVAYDDPEVDAAVREVEEAVRTHVRVPASEWEPVLGQATRVVTTYLVRPVDMLSTFVFDDPDATLPFDQVRWRMRFFEPYAYLHEAIETYAEQRSLSQIHHDTFQSFLARIDAHVVSADEADPWLEVLEPLFALSRAATGAGDVPTRLLRQFFKEKRASDLVQRLQEREQAGHETTSPEALRELIEAEISGEAEAARPEMGPPLDASTREPAEPAPSDSSDDGPSTAAADAFASSEDGGSHEDEGAGSGDASFPIEDTSGTEGAERTAGRVEDDLLRRTWPPASFESGASSGAVDAKDEKVEQSSSRSESFDASGDDTPPSDASRSADGQGPAEEDDVPRTETPGAGETTSDAPDAAESEPDEEATPLWRRFQTVSPSRAESSEVADEQTPRWAQFDPSRASAEISHEDAPEPVGSEIQALERHIFGTSPPPERDVYVRRLFKGSVDAYHEILKQIRQADSWNEASQIIAKEVFRANQVNIYSDVAVDFTDAVEAYFRE